VLSSIVKHNYYKLSENSFWQRLLEIVFFIDLRKVVAL